jgi:hypothetical protein
VFFFHWPQREQRTQAASPTDNDTKKTTILNPNTPTRSQKHHRAACRACSVGASAFRAHARVPV